MIHLVVDKRYQAMRLGPLLKKTADTTLEYQGVEPSASMSLVLTGDAKLKKLNTQFLGENHATDVLSFPSGDSYAPGHSGYLGDVVISLPRARAEAKAGGHHLGAELQLLTVHGILHLLGYDHATQAEKKRMWAAQDEILRKLSVAINSTVGAGKKP